METSNIRVYGIVQGVGFRPFVSRTCQRLSIRGTVANRGSYVEIIAQGDSIDDLIEELRTNPPERAVILNIILRTTDLPEFPDFQIVESERDAGDIFVSPDIAICDKCKQELFDKNNRRYMHPFINCTNCGPRLTILDSMPYDRERTSMKSFAMCPECGYEYTHPETRRYDAQPVCCPNCGPVLYTFDPSDKKYKTDRYVSSDESNQTNALRINNQEHELNRAEASRQAILAARKAIKAGKIVAIKGIGGFHLCCDAKNEDAVSRLRLLKHRPMKPFAVMMKDMDTVRRECYLTHDLYDELISKTISPNEKIENALNDIHSKGTDTGIDTDDSKLGKSKTEQTITELLTGHQKPIVLLPKKEATGLAPSVAPDNPNVGVMLPYTPVHCLLFDYEDDLDISDSLIMTSANVSGAPICRTDENVIDEIADFTDLVLSNDRTIRTRADDTVTDIYRGSPYMIRRSRGYAPLPIMISREVTGQVLAIGGELKNTFCIAKNGLLYPSAYVGDMADIRTVNALEESIQRMEELLEVSPRLVVCDMHPKYNTVAVAKGLGLPVLEVQHHYAHILSCMAENDYLDEVIGVSFDGTGYGTDGTIWGGEYLRCSVHGFERLSHITPFKQAGGDLSSKEGWRIAVSILDSNPEFDIHKMICELGLCSEMEYSILSNMIRTGVNTVTSTSAGRLFDAVSAILGISRSSTFEGEASTALMFEAEGYLRKLLHHKAAICDYMDIYKKDTNKVYNYSELSDLNNLNNINEINIDNTSDIYDKYLEYEMTLEPALRKAIEECDTSLLACAIAARYLDYINYSDVTSDHNIAAGSISDSDEALSIKSGYNKITDGTSGHNVATDSIAEPGSVDYREMRERLAFLFHLGLAEIISGTCRKHCDTTGIKTVALSGGVFQNKLLLFLTEQKLISQGIRVLRHSLIPPNDGGIAVGQALYGLFNAAGTDNLPPLV